MSSLAATQADGFYIPPEYIESGAYKKKSLSSFQNSKGHNQYLQRSVVRFELPYDGFCSICQNVVGKGTRFNAHKSKSGEMYHTSVIWEFKMKCRSCAKCLFVIRNNPAARCFDYVKGIKKKIEAFDTLEAGTAGVVDTDTTDNCRHSIVRYRDLGHGEGGNASISAGEISIDNPISQLERSSHGERVVMSESLHVQSLLKLQKRTMYDDGASNATLRNVFRANKKSKKRKLGEADARGLGKGIELSDKISIDDVVLAKKIFAKKSMFDNEDEYRRHRVCCEKEEKSFFKTRSGSIFDRTVKVTLRKQNKYAPAIGKSSNSRSSCANQIVSRIKVEEWERDTNNSNKNFIDGENDVQPKTHINQANEKIMSIQAEKCTSANGIPHVQHHTMQSISMKQNLREINVGNSSLPREKIEELSNTAMSALVSMYESSDDDK
eukprot:CAMPEP_0194372900 /NCGR_PEP_ID=MMETSP0174-20130528/21306_1 /TAXON_ID=216777 /ORGANISM="Proboscia alata, Strain PI-D3" /LENGTH=436 /DNA_ID=CAMNT_0039151663 /DNA_START=13 /DNA_END=1323 /DNA_ORIENTATION=-